MCMSVEFSPELYYFLGLITGRGRIFESASNKRVILEFAHKNKIQTGIPFCPICKIGVVTNSKCKKCGKKTNPINKVQFDQRKEVLKTIQDVVSPLVNQLVRTKPDITGTDVYTYISIDFSQNNDLFKFIKNQFSPYNNFFSFGIPKSIHTITFDLKLEYLAGITDTAGFPIWGNWHPSGLTRMYIQVTNANWKLPVQLCNFMQNELCIPVQTIDWGHPNIRDGSMKEYKEGKLLSAFREHQIKIFSEQFEKVPLKFYHKKKLLNELISYNKELHIDSTKFCNPPKPISSSQIKVIHDAENSEKIPNELKGQHFDAFWQICWTLGCNRCPSITGKLNNNVVYLTGKTIATNLLVEKKNMQKIREDTTNELQKQWNEIRPKKIIQKSKKTGLTEEDTYEPLRIWLEKYLKKTYPDSEVETFVVADTDMSNFFKRTGNTDHFELVEEFDIRPDVVGFVDKKKMAFIESKITSLGIKEIGQLLGYCLVAKPEIAILCSTIDSSGKLTTILQHDTLFKFGTDEKIKFAHWDHNAKKMNFFGEKDG